MSRHPDGRLVLTAFVLLVAFALAAVIAWSVGAWLCCG